MASPHLQNTHSLTTIVKRLEDHPQTINLAVRDRQASVTITSPLVHYDVHTRTEEDQVRGTDASQICGLPRSMDESRSRSKSRSRKKSESNHFIIKPTPYPLANHNRQLYLHSSPRHSHQPNTHISDAHTPVDLQVPPLPRPCLAIYQA